MIEIDIAGEWARAASILGAAPGRLRRAIGQAVLQEANFFRAKVVEGFRTQAPGDQPFRPLAETTLAVRRFRGFTGTKALIVRGDLRNSIKVVTQPVTFGVEAWVGVLRTARGSDGQSLINVAEIHEFGAGPFVVEVTDAMRAFLMAAFGRGGGLGGGGSGGLRRGFLIIRIPARPFLQPVADCYFSGPVATARFQGRIAAALGGLFGGTGSAETRSMSSVIAASQRVSRSRSHSGFGFLGSIGGALGNVLNQASGRRSGGPSRDPTTGRFVRRS